MSRITSNRMLIWTNCNSIQQNPEGMRSDPPRSPDVVDRCRGGASTAVRRNDKPLGHIKMRSAVRNLGRSQFQKSNGARHCRIAARSQRLRCRSRRPNHPVNRDLMPARHGALGDPKAVALVETNVLVLMSIEPAGHALGVGLRQDRRHHAAADAAPLLARFHRDDGKIPVRPGRHIDGACGGRLRRNRSADESRAGRIRAAFATCPPALAAKNWECRCREPARPLCR